jgi:hypothetical protein
MPSRPRMSTRRVTLVGFVAAIVLAVPMVVLASHQYSDVPNGNFYHADIDAITDAGVTTGCGGGKYCPAAFVTREQMAAFLNRLGALQVGKTPVANAATSQSTDGWSIGCPTGTVLGGGLCFDTGTRGSADVFDASLACGNLGSDPFFGRGQVWKLPSALELRTADLNGDIAITAQEWSSTFYIDDVNGPQAASYNGGGGIIDHNTLDVLPYRCAALPMQQDNIIFIPLEQPQDGSKAGPSTNAGPKVSDNGSQ